MIYDIFLMAAYNFSHRKTRTLLTIIGIVIGVTAIVALTSVASGLKIYIKDQLNSLGADTLIIAPGSVVGGGFGPPRLFKELTKKDVDAVSSVNGVKLASGFLVLNTKSGFRKETQSANVFGVEGSETEQVFSDLPPFQIQNGREISKNDRSEAVIGYGTANDMFSDKIKIGDKIKISGRDFKVVGMLKRIGNQNNDNSVVINMDAVRELFNEPEKISSMFVKVEEGRDPKLVAEEISKRLEKKRGQKDFQVLTSASLADTINSVLSSIEVVIVGIALISVAVGGVGIMNTMFMSTFERTREIGIMKALGATDNVVLSIFLSEAALVGFSGGLIGLFFGSIFATIFSYASQSLSFTIKAVVTPEIITGSLLFSTVIGVVAGFIPARMASKMQPVDALRYE
ncbi:MAG: ABC transporter permease [Candidatus Aenigmarchaeota archaeon]|nr:ABC transporter permease [Candidatus Aenigmarchaeota archaeon]